MDTGFYLNRSEEGESTMLTDHVGGNCVLLFLTESFDSVMTIPPVGETCYRDEWAIACGFGEWGGFRRSVAVL